MMLRLREIHTADTAYPFVEQLWLAAFPEAERRDAAAQRRNTDSNPLFHCLLAESDGQPVGFITYWDFDTFCYGEHLATSLSVRNRGMGAQILHLLFDRIRRPFVLEAELPEDDLTSRRVAFYRRNGLVPWTDFPYTQPAYRKGGETVPLLLMATADLSPDKDFRRVVSRIYRDVYGADLE